MNTRVVTARPIAHARQIRLAVLAVIGCGMLMALLQRGLFFAITESRQSAASAVGFDARLWILWLPLSPLVVWAARRWPFRDAAMPSLFGHLVFAMVLSIVHTFALGALLSGEGRASGFFPGVTALAIWRLAMDALIYGIILAITLALDANARARAEELAATQSATEAARARLHALQMQIQPHFIFNTLNVAAMTARGGDARASADIITKLADLLRELITDAPDTVTLREELAFVQRYLAIERARFGDRLRVSVSVEPSALDARVPRLLLQPIVENAVRHGLSRSATSGSITISATTVDARLVIRVTDDGPGPDANRDDASTGLGLGNTRSRLTVLYGEDFALSLTGDARGAITTISLPLTGARA